MSKKVKSGSIEDPDRLFNDMGLEIGGKYRKIGTELKLRDNVLSNELESGRYKFLDDSEKATKMLLLWKQSVTKEVFTYSVLAAALEKHGLVECAKEFCYTKGS